MSSQPNIDLKKVYIIVKNDGYLSVLIKYAEQLHLPNDNAIVALFLNSFCYVEYLFSVL